MSKHTPGPWHIEYYSCVYAGKLQVAEVFSTAPDGGKTAHATTRLIAAAPDLLDLAEIVLGIAGRNDLPSLPHRLPPTTEQWAVIVAAARAAIAKATGEQP